MNFAVQAHDDGTLTIVHYSTTYHHWWLGEIQKRRGFYTGTIYGKCGGHSVIRLSVEEMQTLVSARKQAQELAYAIDGTAGNLLSQQRCKHDAE